MNEMILEGCAPFPLASYLKALGLVRLVAEQADAGARGSWDRERFCLTSRLDAEGLVHFLLHEYRPTPVLNPWNGGSGFNSGPGDTGARGDVEALEGSRSPRFEAFRRAISAARRARERLGLVEKPDEDLKPRLIALCRATFPEEALPWLDTALVLTPERPEFPPILGTGGNDGRLDFSVTQIRRLIKLFDVSDGNPSPEAEGLLRAALFGLTVPGVARSGIGQFSPQGAGGANASTGFDGGSQANRWDFVLALEGAMLLTASASRRLQDPGASHLAAPFNVQPVSGGYASAGPDDPDTSRAEVWLPLWNRKASLAELRQLFSEGRARVGTHLAATGLDFARAVAGLGVDRGLTGFQRIGFQERNGQAFLAISLGRFQVARNAQAGLVDSLDRDGWLQELRGHAGGNLPASVRRRIHQLQGALFDLCRVPGRDALQRVLVTVGAVHRSFALLPIKDVRKHPRPCPPLDARWLEQADDGSAEYDAAAALAGLAVTTSAGARTRLRWLFDPANASGGGPRWSAERQDEVLRPADDLEQIARASLARLLVLSTREPAQATRSDSSGGCTWRDDSSRRVRLQTLLAWLNAEMDWRRAAELFWGLLLVEPSSGESSREAPGRAPDVPAVEEVRTHPPAAFSLLKLCFAGRPVRDGAEASEGVRVPCDADLLLAALAGQGQRAVSRAAQRLRSSLLTPLVDQAWLPTHLSRRFASAVLLPVGERTLGLLARQVLRPAEPDHA